MGIKTAATCTCSYNTDLVHAHAHVLVVICVLKCRKDLSTISHLESYMYVCMYYGTCSYLIMKGGGGREGGGSEGGRERERERERECMCVRVTERP